MDRLLSGLGTAAATCNILRQPVGLMQSWLGGAQEPRAPEVRRAGDSENAFKTAGKGPSSKGSKGARSLEPREEHWKRMSVFDDPTTASSQRTDCGPSRGVTVGHYFLRRHPERPISKLAPKNSSSTTTTTIIHGVSRPTTRALGDTETGCEETESWYIAGHKCIEGTDMNAAAHQADSH